MNERATQTARRQAGPSFERHDRASLVAMCPSQSVIGPNWPDKCFIGGRREFRIARRRLLTGRECRRSHSGSCWALRRLLMYRITYTERNAVHTQLMGAGGALLPKSQKAAAIKSLHQVQSAQVRQCRQALLRLLSRSLRSQSQKMCTRPRSESMPTTMKSRGRKRRKSTRNHE